MIIKCSCSECNCDYATTEERCNLCILGNHATAKWKDGYKIRLYDTPIDIEDGTEFEKVLLYLVSSKKVPSDGPLRNLFQRYVNEIRKLREQVKQLEAMKGIHWY